ncbi:protein cornichon homolog 4 [Odontomachus brunneus]|uniref:protein cornichon homolog 4 n=1 Tax=Odontomachus brunneus TaxID=486640 RepID=UPI0013F1D24E|nr:protein cornichon homolog 4 [Odontomachus brunneus]
MGLIPDPFLFMIALLSTGGVLLLLVYYIITLSDLECDYLNARECCSKLNTGVMPKLVAHTILVFLLLIQGQLWLTLANVPMTIWLHYEYFSVPSGNMGVYDPTEIHNRSQLKRYMRNVMIHLGYCLVFFFIYLYCLIVVLLKGDPINRNEDELMDM